MGLISDITENNMSVLHGLTKAGMWLHDKQNSVPIVGEMDVGFDKVGREANVVIDNVTDSYDKSVEDVQKYNEGDITAAEVAFRAAGGVGEAFGGTIAAGVNIVLPDWVTKTAGDLMQSGVEITMDTELAKKGLEYLSANPRIARNIEAGMGIAELGLPKAMLEPVKRALSAASNYIPNHYTPSIKNLKDMPTEFKSLTDKLLQFKVKGVSTEKEAFHLAQKLTGASKWAVNGVVGGLNSVFNPKARALYDKHGINSTSQKIVKDEMALAAAAQKRGDTSAANRHKEKAVAQINYNKYITAQTGFKGEVSKAMDSVLNAVSWGGMQPLTKQNYIDSAKMQKNTIVTKNSNGKEISTNMSATDEDLSFVYEQAQKLWSMPVNKGNKLVVKRNTGIGGNHGSDAIANKNKVHKYMRKLYASDGITDPMEIYNHLKSLSKEDFPKGVVLLNKSAEDVALNGLWLSTSHVGSAVVEGGVNVMTKILPNQRAMSFVSDVHDFLEKVPVLGKVLDKALPNGEMSITPPIFSDLRLPDVKKADSTGDKVVFNKGQQGVVTDEMIDAYTKLGASRMQIAAQVPKMAAQSAIISNGLYDYDPERERYLK
tara:strand:+ start:2773 stop:4572 length:1800 start_codon:yes stop_codon:yes gene_type:complete